jgi:hypothetical protein
VLPFCSSFNVRPYTVVMKGNGVCRVVVTQIIKMLSRFELQLKLHKYSFSEAYPSRYFPAVSCPQVKQYGVLKRGQTSEVGTTLAPFKVLLCVCRIFLKRAAI